MMQYSWAIGSAQTVIHLQLLGNGRKYKKKHCINSRNERKALYKWSLYVENNIDFRFAMIFLVSVIGFAKTFDVFSVC